jgi:hypothetical protein
LEQAQVSPGFPAKTQNQGVKMKHSIKFCPLLTILALPTGACGGLLGGGEDDLKFLINPSKKMKEPVL